MDTLVVGLGNPFLSNDSAGIHVARLIQQSLSEELRKTTEVIEASVGGLRLMEIMIGYKKVILIDTINHKNGTNPGQIHCLSVQDLQALGATKHSSCVHDTSLPVALQFAMEMGFSLPDEMMIVAIEIENVQDFSEEISPEISKAIPEAAGLVLEELLAGHRCSVPA